MPEEAIGFNTEDAEVHRGAQRLLHDFAVNSGAEMGDVEVHQKSQAPSGEAEIGEQLRFVNGVNPVYGLHFHYRDILDEEVDPQMSRERHIPISNGYFHLTAKSHPGSAQFVTETLLVDRLQQSGSQLRVHLHATPDD